MDARAPRDPGISATATSGNISDSLYALLVMSVRDYAIFAMDPTGHVLSWNQGAERIKRYRAAEIIGRHFSVFYDEAQRRARTPERELEIATATGRFEDEGWRLRGDGTRFWANIIITALRDETGTLVGFAKVTRDLTERRSAEAALRASDDRFRLLVDSVQDYGIVILDREGRIQSWNVGAERVHGYVAEDIIGRHFSVLYPPSDVESGKPEDELLQAIHEGRFEEEGWRAHRDGSLFWAHVIVTPLREANGTLIGFAKVTRDLTERRAITERAIETARRLAAEEAARANAEVRAREFADLVQRLRAQALELERRSAEAESANRVKSDFLAAMSHELRTPLNAIGGYAELMSLGLRGPLTAEQHQDLDRIRRSQQHLLGIINDILNFSRIEAGRVSYNLTAVSASDVLDAVMAMIAPQAGAKGVRLERTVPDEDVIMQADRGKVEQILLNVVSNAIKVTPKGGLVAIRAAVTGNRVEMQVHDTGSGISADKLEDIFEPFVQVGRNLTRQLEGTGLGLAIGRDLARAMGGDLTVESIEGEGSTFTLTLPKSSDS
jgi:PAS domain S-box-containing protein